MSRKNPYKLKRKQQKAAQETAEKKPGLEERAVKWTLRTAAMLFFCGYVFLSVPATFIWAGTMWVRHAPVNHATVIAQHAITLKNDPEYLRNWLARRPYTEVDEIIKLLQPYMGKMDGMTFILFSDWKLSQGDVQQALYWRQRARFRIRLDSLRCGAWERITTMTDLMDIIRRPEIDAIYAQHPDMLEKSLQDALDFDARYPAEDDPTTFCQLLQKMGGPNKAFTYEMVRREVWPGIRGTLRAATQIELDHIRQARENGQGPEGQTPDGRLYRDYKTPFGPDRAAP